MASTFNVSFILNAQQYVNSRLLRTTLLALALAIAGMAFASTALFAQTAVDDSATTLKEQSVTISVAANDEIPGGVSGATFTVESGPSHGTVSGGDTDGIFLYTPSVGFVGQDSFTYMWAKGLNDATATVNIRVLIEPFVSPRIVKHAATPVQCIISGSWLNLYFVGDGGVGSGPAIPSVKELAEMHPAGSGNIVLYSGVNSVSRAPVTVTYLSADQLIHVNTAYRDNHNGAMKPYIFAINENNEVAHWVW